MASLLNLAYNGIPLKVVVFCSQLLLCLLWWKMSEGKSFMFVALIVSSNSGDQEGVDLFNKCTLCACHICKLLEFLLLVIPDEGDPS